MMKKLLYRSIIFATAAVVPFIGVNAFSSSFNADSIEIAQRANSAQSAKVLPVALPESATVRLVQGGSATGQLTAFDSSGLTLSAYGQSETYALSQIGEVELNGTVWLPNPDPGRGLEAYRIRGLSLALEDIPLDALTWNGTSNLVELDLQGVLTQGEFNRLTQRNPDLVYALVRIRFEPSSSTTMNVKVKALGQ